MSSRQVRRMPIQKIDSDQIRNDMAKSFVIDRHKSYLTLQNWTSFKLVGVQSSLPPLLLARRRGVL